MSPDNISTILRYQELAKEDPFKAYIISDFFHKIETKRLKIALKILMERLNGDLGDIVEIMTGFGRNLPTLRTAFPKSNIELVDSSQDMMDYAQKFYLASQ